MHLLNNKIIWAEKVFKGKKQVAKYKLIVFRSVFQKSEDIVISIY